eukprot:m.114973 g.114973  ORF g.114973 m.114973 type:complete len:338 (+) comp9285_c0_seq2:210-1223(+)
MVQLVVVVVVLLICLCAFEHRFTASATGVKSTCKATQFSELQACVDHSAQSPHQALVIFGNAFPLTISDDERRSIIAGIRRWDGLIEVRFENIEMSNATHWMGLVEAVSSHLLQELVMWKPGDVDQELIKILLGNSASKSSLLRLTISDVSLGPAVPTLLTLFSTSILKELVLRDAALSSSHMSQIFSSLPTTLSSLELSCIDKVNYASYLDVESAEALGKRRDLHLQKLVLNGVDIHDDACRMLMSGASYTPSLSIISLRQNNVGDSCAESIAELCNEGALDHMKIIVLTLNHLSSTGIDLLESRCLSRGLIVDTQSNKPLKKHTNSQAHHIIELG